MYMLLFFLQGRFYNNLCTFNSLFFLFVIFGYLFLWSQYSFLVFMVFIIVRQEPCTVVLVLTKLKPEQSV